MKTLFFSVLLPIVFISVVVLSPIIFVLNVLRKLFRKEDLYKYIKAVVIGFDQIGGSLLYGTKDWTISSYTFILHDKGVIHATYFMEFIDWYIGLFTGGKDHCARAYRNEHSQHLKGGV